MAMTATGLFRTPRDAQKAILALLSAGIDRNAINLIANDPNGEEPHGDQFDEERGRATGVTLGAEIGGIAGLLAGLASVFIPGLGVVVLAGPIVGLLAGAGVGAAAGAVMGSLNEVG